MPSGLPYIDFPLPEYPDLESRLEHLNLTPDKIKVAYGVARVALGTTAYVDDLAERQRIPRDSRGDRELLTTHSLWVGVAGDQIADLLGIEEDIDRGELYRRAAVHDATEILTDDQNTFNISLEARKDKKEREQRAKEDMIPGLPQSMGDSLEAQEDKIDWQARYLGLIDKLGPTALNIVSDQMRIIPEELKVYDADTLATFHDKLNKLYAEQAGNDEVLRIIVAAHAIQGRHLEEKVRNSLELVLSQEKERPPTEVERKFLMDLEQLPSEIDLADPRIEREHLRQVYTEINKDGSEIRYRCINNRKPILKTRKSGGSLNRTEETSDAGISVASFHDIIKNDAIDNVIDKTRYKIPLGGGKVLELDMYHSVLEGLVTGEVEFEGRDAVEEAEAWVPPTWFGKDITEDSRFKNKKLTKVNDVRKLLDEAV